MSKITFITGGARSGKSAYALKLASRFKKPVFIATGEALDNEMRSRIARHKKERPCHWATLEEPIKVSALINKMPGNHDCILIDCLTLLVSNMLLKRMGHEMIMAEICLIFESLKKRGTETIIVSNEVGMGIVPDNRLARDFRDIAGTINKVAAEHSDRMFFMVSGIPLRVK